MLSWDEIKNKCCYTVGDKLVTGYFAKLKKYKTAGYTPVAICGKSPEFYKGIEYKKLAPYYDFFVQWKNAEITNDDYIIRYYQQVLSKLSPEKVIAEINTLTNGNRTVLLCYEKPFDFCHRHIVSQWLNIQELAI